MPSSNDTLRQEFADLLKAADNTASLEAVRLKFLGKKGLIPDLMKQMGALGPDERKAFGASVNSLKDDITEALATKGAELKARELNERLRAEAIDVTLPGKYTPIGSEHPINRTLRDIVDIFVIMGFDVEEGPEVESDYYNFEALNIPKHHPARDMQDTFYVSEDVVLRTHTSPVQVRVMQEKKPPLRFVAPGKVYRCDADVSHSPMFHQVEGLMVGEDITFAHLKGVLETFIHRYFGPKIPVRFRPSFFPFTEPSAEVDMGCIFCNNTGCRICKGTGWIEILGSGMVNPRVFEMAGYDPAIYNGFAFGMGVERIAMLSYGIDDLRTMFDNDMRFLRQF